MADAQQPTNGNDDTSAVTGDDATGASHDTGTAHVDAAWLAAEAPAGDVVVPHTTEADLPGDHYLLATTTVAHDAVGSVDHALHQLTTATDLFDVPVIDFHDHGFGT